MKLHEIKQMLDNPDVKARLFALERLVRIQEDHPAEVADLVLAAARSEDPRVRFKALTLAPGLVARRETVARFLQDQLCEQDPEVRMAVLTGLRRMEFPPSLLALKSFLAGLDDEKLIAAAIPLAGRLPREEAIPLLVPYLSSRWPRVRAGAIESLALFKGEDETLRQKIRALWRDPEPRVKANAFLALFPEEATDILKTVKLDLKVGTVRHRISTCYAISRMPHEELLLLLIRALDDTSKKVAAMAARSLSKLANSRLIPMLLDRYLGETDPTLRGELLGSASSIDEGLYFSHLKELFLIEKDPRTRASLAAAFARVKPGRQLFDFLSRFALDPNARVRANLVEILGSPSCREPEDPALDNEVQQLLQRALLDENNRVRANAARALWDRGGHGVVTTVKHMLLQADPRMRASAAFVLGEMKGLQFHGLIQDTVVDIDPDVRKSALKALATVQKKLGISTLQ